EMHKVVRKLLEREGIFELRLVGDFLFINDARLRLDLSDYAAFSYVIGALDRHGIGRIEFGPAVTQRDLAPFMSLLLGDDDGTEAAYERFQQRFAASGTANISIDPLRGVEEPDDAEDEDRQKEAAKLTYFQSVHVAK